METETRTLKCNLTKEERDAKADEAGRRLRDLESAQLVIDTKTRELKSAKETASSIQSSLNALIDVRERGWENRQVDCTWRTNRERQIRQLVRGDTGEVIETHELPAQQTIDGVVTSTQKPTTAPEVEGVEVGSYGEDPDGAHYRVSAVSPDSVVVEYPNKTTKRISAGIWPAYAPNPDIDQQDYRDAFEQEESDLVPEAPVEKSEYGQKILRALDREGLTVEELAAEVGLAKQALRGHLYDLVAGGFAVEGKRETGARGRKPVTYATTDKGEAAIGATEE